MQQLANKRIVLGICGSIAAYKSADLVRRYVTAGADVQVVMTSAAAQFITPLTLQTLSGRPVRDQLFDIEAESTMGHIALARWADVIVVAPASADFIARLAQGKADDLLSALCLASQAPVAIAPAMNQQMWHQAATQHNIARLAQRGILLFGPAQGEQACGEVGLGRLLEPDDIAASTAALFSRGELAGLKVLVTAGPTQEAIDPVRFVSNRSSGKMGFAIAAAAVAADAQVTLISGPVALATPDRVTRLDVISAQQMYDQVLAQAGRHDILIAAAAVADYRPTQIHEQKLKKTSADLTLALTRTEDIVAAVAALPQRPFCVGFAAETDQLLSHARHKLQAKRLDMIAANWVGQDGSGFDSDENALTLLWGEDSMELPLAPKSKLARQLISQMALRYYEKNTIKNSG